MNIETRNRGISEDEHLAEDARRALAPALDRFAGRVLRVRVRFVPMNRHRAACRVRVWCDRGPTVLVAAEAASSREAVHAVADRLSYTLSRKWPERRHRSHAVRRPALAARKETT